MMTEIQTVEGGQKRCPPKEDQHLKKKKKNFHNKKVEHFYKWITKVSAK